MTKKHITIFAVYKTFMILGKKCRYFKIAFPSLHEAEQWVEDHCKSSLFTKEDYLIEEMPAIMKAWQP